MGGDAGRGPDVGRGSAVERRTFDPRTTPVPRRRVLLLIGAGAGVLAAGGGLAVLLEGCSGPPVTVTVDFDTATLVVGTPVEVPFTLPEGSGSMPASAWLVKTDAGEIVAFDPRCTHALCAYEWLAAVAKFKCHCHDGTFALDGKVLSGPPPHALDRFPARVTGTALELDVPSNFVTPKESL